MLHSNSPLAIYFTQSIYGGFPGGSVVKNHLPSRRCRFHPWVGKIPWRRKWQPTPVFLPGKSHGQTSLAGYSPEGCKRVRHILATKTTVYIYQSQSPSSSLLCPPLPCFCSCLQIDSCVPFSRFYIYV